MELIFVIYAFLANGFEETEAIAPIDLLKRAKRNVVTVGVGGKAIASSHGITVECDITTSGVALNEKLEGIILPGGMPGTLNLEADATVNAAIDYCAKKGKLIGAICAAPSILGHKGLLAGKRAICYPGFEKELKDAIVTYEPAVTDGNIITARGAGAALEFGLALVEYLLGESESSRVSDSICFSR